jgi:hypothetical protein
MRPTEKERTMSDDDMGFRILNEIMTFGGVIAVCISWSVNHSILWAMLHGMCSWGYVIYYACGGGK